jgi:GMP synthase (glutamine-hydrolysing)
LLRQIVYVQVESLFSLEIPLLLINPFILNTILFDATDTYNNLNKKILSIKNINFETLGTLERLFHLDGYQIENVEAQTESIPINADQYLAIVILGGPIAAYDNKIAHLTKEQELIRNAIKNGIPVLGICLGSQLIAQAIGGRVFRGPIKEIGWFEVTLTPDGRENLFKGFTDKTLRVFQWHGDTYELPSTAKIMASSNLYPQAFEFGSAIGLQFHLEVNTQMIERWLQEYSEEIKREHIKPEDILLPEKTKYIMDLYNACKVVHSNFSKQIDFQRKK